MQPQPLRPLSRADDGVDDRVDVPARGRSSAARRRRAFFMRPRRLLLLVHRWLAIVLTAWLVLIGVSGAYLAEQHAIEARLFPARYEHGEGDLGPGAARRAVDAVKSEKGTISRVVMPAYGRGVYEIVVTEPAPDKPRTRADRPATRDWTYFVDPSTAHINDAAALKDDGFSWWVYRGHRYLWQENGLFGADAIDGGWCVPEPDGLKGLACTLVPKGSAMVGYFGVAWFAILLTGAYVWFWPGVRRWATALRVRRARGPFTLHLDLHRAIGLVFWLPLTVIAFTGMAFAFDNIESWYDNVTPAQEDFELRQAPSDLRSGPADGRSPLDLDGAVTAMRRAFPDRQIASVSAIPKDEKGTWRFRADYGFSPRTREGGGGNSLVAIDQFTGSVLFDGTPEAGNVADQLWDDWRFPLHAGDAGGPFTRALWVLVGFSPVALAVTGVMMFLLRRRKRAQARARQATRRPGPVEPVIDLREGAIGAPERTLEPAEP